MRDLEIAVLGAGVIGLNTALQIQNKFRNSQITLIDDKFNQETLSYGPAGIFRPSSNFAGISPDIVKQWIEYSFQYYKELLFLPESGITKVAGYLFSNVDDENVKNQFLENLVPVYRAATIGERNLFNNSWKYGSYFETIRIQCKLFLPWAINRFMAKNGILKKQKIDEFSELKNKFNVVFNCTGLGSKYLCKDNNLVPIRGQTIKIFAPWIQKFYYNDFDTYILPLGDGNVCLGGCRNYESYNVEINSYDSSSILQRCTNLIPSISKAKILSEWVGLRPHRHILRLETEKQQNLTIVHNYGHGGYGITSAPGTANFAVKEFQKSHLCNSKL